MVVPALVRAFDTDFLILIPLKEAHLMKSESPVLLSAEVPCTCRIWRINKYFL